MVNDARVLARSGPVRRLALLVIRTVCVEICQDLAACHRIVGPAGDVFPRRVGLSLAGLDKIHGMVSQESYSCSASASRPFFESGSA